jgi:hypothetical protein
MGAYWLHGFPAQAAARGLVIDKYPGWELRSRTSGGFDGIWGVCLHHSGSPTTQSDANAMSYCWKTAPFPPVGNFFLSRTGRITIGAAGASNTQGVGGPIQTSRGFVPKDASNRYHVAIEAANNGRGEKWSQAQLDAYLKLVWCLCDVYGFDPTVDVIFHQTWAPDRKADPAGPTPAYPAWGGLSGVRTWNLSNFRQSVLGYGVPVIPDMSDFKITNPVRIADTRQSEGVNPHNPVKGPFGAGGVAVLKPHGFTPGDASGVILTLTGVGYGPGYFTVWNGEGLPPGSTLNTIAGQAVNNMAWVPLRNGTFSVYSHGSADIMVDQVGWYWA